MIAKPLLAPPRRLIALLLLCSVAGHAQTLEQTAPVPVAGGGDDPAVRLSNELRVLAGDPRDLSALDGAGRAALDIGDFNGALGFFGRAEQVAPQDGRAKAGLAAALVQLEQPQRALPLFARALQLGVAPVDIAADRGLAYDLVGDPASAQRDYELALAHDRDDETLCRYALSLGISRKKDRALDLLDPLVRRRDPAGWRARAFVLALTGDTEGANAIVAAMLPNQAAAMKPFLAELARLTPAQQAAAVNFGDMPARGGAATMLATRDAVPAMPTPLMAPASAPTRTQPAPRPAIIATTTAGAALVPSGTPLGTPATRADAVPAAVAPRRIEERSMPPVQIAAAIVPSPRGEAASRGTPPPAPAITSPRVSGVPQPQPASQPIVQPMPMPVPAPATGTIAAPMQLAAAALPVTPAPDTVTSSRPAPPPVTAPSVRPGFSGDVTAAPPVPGFIGPPAPSPVAQVAIAPSQPAVAERTASETSPASAHPPSTVVPRPAGDQLALAEPTAERDTAARAARPETGAAAWHEAFASARAAPPEPTRGASTKTVERAASRAGSSAAKAEADAETGSKARHARRIADADDATATKTRSDKDADSDATRERDSDAAGSKRKPSGKSGDADKTVRDSRTGSDSKTGRGADADSSDKRRASKRDAADSDRASAAKDEKSSSDGRIYVQVATGANKDDMPKAWAGVRRQAPDLLKGKSPSTTPLRFTNRLLVGPFKDKDAAQDFVNKLAGKHMSGAIFTSADGQKIEKVPAGK